MEGGMQPSKGDACKSLINGPHRLEKGFTSILSCRINKMTREKAEG
jgi:hypothetical protein